MKNSHKLAIAGLFFTVTNLQQSAHCATPVNLRIKPLTTLLTHHPEMND
jgi:hypothetical protein